MFRKRRKVPGTVAEVMDFADELFKQVGETGAQVSNDAATLTLHSAETDVSSLSADSKKACEEVTSAKAELNALRAVPKLATKEHNVALAKVREEPQVKFEAWKATTSRDKSTSPKVLDKMSVEVSKLRCRRDCVGEFHHELLGSIRRVVRARDELMDKVAETLVKLRKIYDDGRNVAVKAQVAE